MWKEDWVNTVTKSKRHRAFISQLLGELAGDRSQLCPSPEIAHDQGDAPCIMLHLEGMTEFHEWSVDGIKFLLPCLSFSEGLFKI